MVPAMSQTQIPEHLHKYVVKQNYENYTWEDQAVWRYIMRRLVDFLSRHAHPCYLEGLAKSGISTEAIPRIEEMDRKLAEFGWGALPVSGFIPPAAFMEFQSLGILPIASDMRTLDHLLYTPAPDIVHEAAGHAPILIDPAFARYLKRYGEVASHAIITKEDMDQYEAIRQLSDIKENPDSRAEDIKKALDQLDKATAAISYVSEAAFLSRMNWWTAEYGLIGNLHQPKIFGAGLLSSVGESKDCLSDHVAKIPLTIHCLDYQYDITEPQPQLFVAANFESLELVLDQMADRMAFRQGGLIGLEKALQAKTVNTVELNSGLQISGILESCHTALVAGLIEPIFFRFSSPTQLSLKRNQLEGHGTQYHSHGFSSPIGLLKNEAKCLSNMDSQDLQRLGLTIGATAKLSYASGIQLEGIVKKICRGEGKIVLISFDDCTLWRNQDILFRPEWGTFDLAVGQSVSSVFGGPADRSRFDSLDDFVAKRVPPKHYSAEQLKVFSQYQLIRDLRENKEAQPKKIHSLEKFVTEYLNSFSSHWLMGIELLELATSFEERSLVANLTTHLQQFKTQRADVQQCISEGIRLSQRISP